MHRIMTRGLPVLLGCAGLLGGCSGLRVHRPQDLVNAQAAQSELKAADLANTVTAERERLNKVLAEELELVRKHTLARRDAHLIYLIGEGDSQAAWEYLAKQIQSRTQWLGFDAASLKATLAKIAELPTAEAALGQSSLDWEVLRATDSSLPRLSCPLPESMDGAAFSGRAKIRFTDYADNCDAYLDKSDIPTKNGAELEKLREAKAKAEAVTQAALDAVSQARSEYIEALSQAAPDLQAERRQKVLDAIRDLGDLGNRLQEIRDAEGSLGKLGLQAAAADLTATLEKAKMQVERGNVIAALSAALDGEAAQRWLFPRLQKPAAGQFVDALVGLGPALDAKQAPGPVTSLLVRQEQLDLDIRAAEKREAFLDSVILLLEEQDQAYRDELIYLGQTLRLLTDLENHCLSKAGAPEEAAARLFEDSKRENCREKVFRLLVAYSSSWTLGRLEAAQIDQRLIGLHQQAALDLSEIAFAKWQSLFTLPTGQLVALYETGIRPQDVLDLLDLLGLGAIAAGVN